MNLKLETKSDLERHSDFAPRGASEKALGSNAPSSDPTLDLGDDKECLKSPSPDTLTNDEPEPDTTTSPRATDPSSPNFDAGLNEKPSIPADGSDAIATPSYQEQGSSDIPDGGIPPRGASDIEAPPPNDPPRLAPQKQSWRRPRQNTWRMVHVCLAFLNFGLNDASYGALLPTLESYYSINYTVASLIFLSTFFGYTLSALANDLLHQTLGQRGAAFLSPLCRLIAYTLLSLHLPWPVLVIGLIICGIGNGIAEGAWNAWIGGLENSNELLGLLHGSYGLGATVAPVVATALVSEGKGWWVFYYILLGTNVVEMGVGTGVWWGVSGRVFRENVKMGMEEGEKDGGRMGEAVRNRVVWLIAVFFFLYVGAEVSLGGFIPSFLLSTRTTSIFTAGIAATGFWAGLTLGRVTLGFITPHLGERRAITGYLLLALALQLIFWLVPSFAVSALAVALLGFFIGPLFPSAVVVGTKLLPERLHVVGVGFAAAVGGGGAAVLPFAVGAIAQAKGVGSLEPFVVAVLVVLLGVWWCFPRIPGGGEKIGDGEGNGNGEGEKGGRRERWRRKRGGKREVGEAGEGV